jgi:3-hydroxyacyl-[acyl-carrier-protein] dehydratase
MLLEKNFYTVQSFTSEEGVVKASISINAAHEIFKGHFPGSPVVPGVCMAQIVKELLEKEIEIEIRLVKADHLKFLSVINPVENNIANVEVKYKVTESDIDVIAFINNSAATCFKMKAQFMFF